MNESKEDECTKGIQEQEEHKGKEALREEKRENKTWIKPIEFLSEESLCVIPSNI